MAFLLLVRHALTDLTGTRLYGTSPGVLLSERGREQARLLAEHLRPVRLEAMYTSPLERCADTAAAIAAGRDLEPRPLPGVIEVEYGDLTGKTFVELRKTELWRSLHEAPSTVRFPGGETLAEVQARSVTALEELAERHDGAVAVVTHGDVIRLSLAHFAGIDLDLFHRLDVDPASVSVLELGGGGPRVLRVNDTGTLEGFLPDPGGVAG